MARQLEGAGWTRAQRGSATASESELAIPSSGGVAQQSSDRGSRREGLTWAFVGVLLFSFSVPLTKEALGGFDPFLTATGRAVIAGLLAVTILAIRRVPVPARRHWSPLFFTMLGAVFGWPILLALALAAHDVRTRRRHRLVHAADDGGDRSAAHAREACRGSSGSPHPPERPFWSASRSPKEVRPAETSKLTCSSSAPSCPRRGATCSARCDADAPRVAGDFLGRRSRAATHHPGIDRALA